MCGIAGIFGGKASQGRSLSQRLEAMQAALRHRGPDDQGMWMSEDGTTGLAHTRLAILDLSPAGHQPMASTDGRQVIVFNGEIYNFRALRRMLEEQGQRFHSESDTEVLLAMHAVFGSGMLRHLQGMFSFAIWNPAQKSAFLARDPFGIKPLYYSVSHGSLVFASEVRAVLAGGPDEPRRLDPQALCSYLAAGSLQEPRTLIEGIRSLPAGHALTWTAGNAETTACWSPVFPPESRMDPLEATRITRTALLESVERHFVSDVPVGLFLSGGIDSTAVLALARELGKTNLQTYSVGPDVAEFDESALAARTAQAFGTKHTTLRLSAGKARSLFQLYLQSTDLPSIDGLNTFSVSALAREHGAKVVLSGLGGDELFGGYPSFTAVPKMLQWGRRLRASGLGWAASRLMRRSKSGRFQRLGEFLGSTPSISNAYRAYRSIRSWSQAAALASRITGAPGGSFAPPGEDTSLPQDPGNAVSVLELTRYMRNQLLRDSDANSMAWGLELRLPLVDRRLFESVSVIPAALRLAKGKQLLLDATKDVPEWVWNQKKRGFMFPFQQWINAEWGDIFGKADSLLQGAAATWYERWSLAVLIHWMERNGVEP